MLGAGVPITLSVDVPEVPALPCSNGLSTPGADRESRGDVGGERSSEPLVARPISPLRCSAPNSAAHSIHAQGVCD